MNNFIHSIPTKVYFGKGQLAHLSEIKESGSKVLVVSGEGSIKKNGIYNKVLNILRTAGLRIYELPGVKSNPEISSVREGVRICKANSVNMILAVGGGSVIDTAKVIAGGASYGGDSWSIVIHPRYILKALPVYAVVTHVGSGSETNGSAVISDPGHDKCGTTSPLLRPVMTICDPEVTYTVNDKQTAAGTAEIMTSALESYFTNVEGGYLQARFCEGIMKTCIAYGPVAVAEPENYDARANLMWASANSFNGILSEGAETVRCAHLMEYALSVYYDLVPGQGLAVLVPHLMKFALNEETAGKFAEYGRNVWGIAGDDNMEVSEAAIGRTGEFFANELHMPTTLRELGIEDESRFEDIASKAAGCRDAYVPLTEEDIVTILKAAF